MATNLDPRQVVCFEEILMSQVVSQDVLMRLLIQKGIFTEGEFLKMVKEVNHEMKTKKKG